MEWQAKVQDIWMEKFSDADDRCYLSQALEAFLSILCILVQDSFVHIRDEDGDELARYGYFSRDRLARFWKKCQRFSESFW